MKQFVASLVCLFFFVKMTAQTPTWATDVAPILFKKCAGCHRPDNIAPFSLLSYNDAFENRFSIQNETESKQMPPWMPNPTYRHFADETNRRLTDSEISTIKTWVENDAPSGDLSLAPPQPVFPIGSEIGTPDLQLTTPNFTVTATADEYRCFVIPSGLLTQKFLRAIEVIPGNRGIIHHALIYADTTGQAKQLDAATPEPGYVNFGGPGVNSASLIGGWVPGSKPILFPKNMGIRLPPNCDLVIQIHYPAGSTGQSDQSKINLFFTPTTAGVRQVFNSPLLNHGPTSLENFPLILPPNQVKTYHEKYKTLLPGSVLTVGPHMHLIGKKIESFGVTAAGDTIPFIKIDNWDFHWQGSYAFQKVVKVPSGTTLHAYATYDNTTANDDNPNNPPKLVVQGESTTDEMMLVYFTFMAYQTGDENIVLDSTLLSSSLRPVPTDGGLTEICLSPNPASSQFAADFNLTQPTDLQAVITDLSGRELILVNEKMHFAAGSQRLETNVGSLPSGAYFLKIQTDSGLASRTFLVQH